MALSLVGSELWPPLLVTSSLKLRKTFSAACMAMKMGLPFLMWPPPASALTQNWASMRSRCCVTSQSAPLALPPSSSAVRARVWSGDWAQEWIGVDGFAVAGFGSWRLRVGGLGVWGVGGGSGWG